MRTAIITTFIVTLLVSCGTSTSTETASKDQSIQETTKPAEPKSNWEYSEDVDEMDGTTTYFASVESENKVDFEFPYNGGSRLQLVARNMDNSNNVILSISSGQFITSIMNDEYIRIKYDDNEPEKVSFSSSNDGASDYIFVSDSDAVLTKLKTASKVMIEAPFFDAGRQVFHFNLAGLKWDY